ncbi:hypothetical protein CVT25_010259 [Psilocybe cyanescens]|uniref:Uncharacterized protein n=1 Tax=Psilocybe cyanescens TaxID=93625 RepID=A0A409XD21_PSICY|nr:hypothetical protein CVT25_010259 [Psilocybe cyanescens]
MGPPPSESMNQNAARHPTQQQHQREHQLDANLGQKDEKICPHVNSDLRLLSLLPPSSFLLPLSSPLLTVTITPRNPNTTIHQITSFLASSTTHRTKLSLLHSRLLHALHTLDSRAQENAELRRELRATRRKVHACEAVREGMHRERDELREEVEKLVERVQVEHDNDGHMHMQRDTDTEREKEGGRYRIGLDERGGAGLGLGEEWNKWRRRNLRDTEAEEEDEGETEEEQIIAMLYVTVARNRMLESDIRGSSECLDNARAASESVAACAASLSSSTATSTPRVSLAEANISTRRAAISTQTLASNAPALAPSLESGSRPSASANGRASSPSPLQLSLPRFPPPPPSTSALAPPADKIQPQTLK